MKQVGEFTQTVIDKLQLNISAGTPIFIGNSNEEHIKKRHPYEYDEYYNKIPEIISRPDFIGLNRKDNSIQYIKWNLRAEQAAATHC